jgi:hypothetical protein
MVHRLNCFMTFCFVNRILDVVCVYLLCYYKRLVKSLHFLTESQHLVIVSDISSLLLQFVRVHVGPYQTLRTRPVPERSGSPFWNEDLMFVAAEPFDDLMHLIVEDRVGPKVSGQKLLM